MRQERSSANIGQESSEDDRRDELMCGAASRRFSMSCFALGLVLSNLRLLKFRRSNVMVLFRLA